MDVYNSRRFRHKDSSIKGSRKIPTSLLKSAGLDDCDGFKDILDSFRYIGGRRFHNTTANYALPNDKLEVDRLNLSHCLLRYAFGGNYSSPIQNKLKSGIKVLDIGCGTGNWLIENAKEYPKSTFVGMDISPIFQTEDKPENAGFIECDVLNGLPFPSNTFDFVHQRLLYSSFTEKQWIKMIKEITRVLKPSGYVEFMELDAFNFRNPGPYTKDILGKVKQSYKDRDICLEVPSKLKGFIDSTKSFSEVKLENRILSLGKWDGKFGELMLEYFRMSIESYSVVLTRKFKYTKEEYNEILNSLLQEVEKYKSRLVYTRFYAQKV